MSMIMDITTKLDQRKLEGATMFQTKYPQTDAGWAKFQVDFRKYNQDHPVFDDDYKKKVEAVINQQKAQTQGASGAPVVVPSVSPPPGFQWPTQ